MKLVSAVLLFVAAQALWAQSFSYDLADIKAKIIIGEKLQPATPKMSDGFSSGIGGGPGGPARRPAIR